jgi:hypothetical protein
MQAAITLIFHVYSVCSFRRIHSEQSYDFRTTQLLEFVYRPEFEKYKILRSFGNRPRASQSRRKQLTPWSEVLLEKLPGPQLVKKFSSFYETRRFITAFTTTRHLSYPEPDQSSP